MCSESFSLCPEAQGEVSSDPGLQGTPPQTPEHLQPRPSGQRSTADLWVGMTWVSGFLRSLGLGPGPEACLLLDRAQCLETAMGF